MNWTTNVLIQNETVIVCGALILLLHLFTNLSTVYYIDIYYCSHIWVLHEVVVHDDSADWDKGF